MLKNSPLLQNLYETTPITRFCVGTWPSADNLFNSVCVQGLVGDANQKPYEFNRLVVFPQLIKTLVPFSNVSVEPGQEPANAANIKNILQTCSSHLIQLTPNAPG